MSWMWQQLYYAQYQDVFQCGLRLNSFDFPGFLILRNVFDFSPSSVCGIFRSGPSDSQHCRRKEGGKEKGTGHQRSRCCRHWGPPSTSWSLGYCCSRYRCWGFLLSVAASMLRQGEGGTPNSPMSSSKFRFFPLAAGPLLWFPPMQLELPSLTELWSEDRMSKRERERERERESY